MLQKIKNFFYLLLGCFGLVFFYGLLLYFLKNSWDDFFSEALPLYEKSNGEDRAFLLVMIKGFFWLFCAFCLTFYFGVLARVKEYISQLPYQSGIVPAPDALLKFKKR